MDYEIHHTGSKGNANIIIAGGYRILFDIGVSYKALNEMKLNTIDMLIISHRHSDHIKMSTYNRLLNNYPNILVITNQEVSDFIEKNGGKHEPDVIIDSGLAIDVSNIRINFIENLHGVSTQGVIIEENEELLLYATDLSQTVYYEDWLDKEGKKLDICLLENNYDLKKLTELEHTGYNIYEAQGRHLEHEDYNSFVEKYCREDTITEELHQSSSMY